MNCIERKSHCKGYNQTNYKGRKWRTHRLVYFLLHGNIPDGYVVCHHCDNPSCINPTHLFLATQAENLEDMRKKGRANYGKKLTREQAEEIKLRLMAGEYAKDIAVDYPCSVWAIFDIKQGRHWKL